MFGVEDLHGAPIPQFAKVRLTALRIGELVIATFPGEVTAHLAKQLKDEAKKQSGGKIKDMAVFGYSQEHHLYILDEADWWQGGYEPSMTIWGPKYGAFLLQHLTELSLQALKPQAEINDTGILPQDFYGLDFSLIEVPREVTPDAGKIFRQPTPQYHRLDPPITFTVIGGFQGIDNPRVILQLRQKDNSFVDFMRNGVRVYDDSDHRMIMNFAKIDQSYHYTFSFEELEDFPLGHYRFKVLGHKWDGTKRVAYEVHTDAFEILSSQRLKIWDLNFDGRTIKGWVSYPPGTNDDGKNRLTKLEPTGHRLRSELVRWQIGPPLHENSTVKLHISIKQANKQVAELSAQKLDQRKVVPQTFVIARDDQGKEQLSNTEGLASGFQLQHTSKLPAGKYEITVTIADQFGNTGKWGPSNVTVP
jgi:hypothetical protein